MKTFFLTLFLVLAAGCQVLAPDGIYKQNKLLYQADKQILTAYDTMHAFVKWEYENRDFLKQWPEIKQSADKVRLHAKNWTQTAITLRDIYEANQKDEEARLNLQQALAVLKVVLTEISFQMQKGAQ